MMDIDNFKAINDNYGHHTGDEVIIKTAQLAAGKLRDGVDVIGRLGGEEFAVLLPQTTLEGTRQCAERIRNDIENYAFDFAGDRFQVTVSLGITQLRREDVSFLEILKRADRALYAAKHRGRNCVVVLNDHCPVDADQSA
jgi:diguanylate cyclase (GGDEF)-like protein